MVEQLSYEAFRNRRYIPALDGMRALSILGVLVHHARGNPFYMLNGFRGVWIFFVISGFLITTLALREEECNGQLNIKGFMIRRVFRILPLYYLALAAYVVWAFQLHMEPNADRFAQHMLSFLLYVPEFPIFRYQFAIPFGITWSLGIEEKFYLVWPLLAFALLARSQYRLWVTLGLIVIGLILMMQAGWLAQMWGSYVDILIGCLLAQLLHKRSSYEWIAVLGRPYFAWGAIAVLAVATVTGSLPDQAGERVFTLLAAVAIAALVTNQRGPATVVGLPWLVALGTWSYAVYLFHGIAFGIANRLMPAGRIGDLATLPVALLLTVPVCWLLHIYFEKPLIGVGRQLAARSAARTNAGLSNAGDRS